MATTTPQQLHTASVLSVDALNPTYYLARFQSDPKDGFHFSAGQYIIFQLPPPKLRHSMSIASSPNPGGTFDILQGVVPEGLGTQWTKSLQAGQTVSFMGPFGRFGLRPTTGKTKVFIATGCGIAPFASMIPAYLDNGGVDPVLLFWGMRHEQDLFWKNTFDRYALQHPQFSWYQTLSQPTPAWSGKTGRVTAHISGIYQTNAEYYLCGSSMMIGDVRKLLLERGVGAVDILSEAFF
jgi:NAD(P)H-flavin reductase